MDAPFLLRPVPKPSILQRAWRAAGSAALIFVMATCVVLSLSYFSAGTGAIIAVEGKPQDPTTRIPLGGNLEFGLRWHFLEGGCTTQTTATFTGVDPRGGEIAFTRVNAMAPRAVGQPGFERVARPLPAGIGIGHWHYDVRAESVCPTRRPPPVSIAAFDFEVYDPQGAITRLLAPVQVLTPRVSTGGPLQYRVSFERISDLPTTVIRQFVSLDRNDGDVVSRTAPAGQTAPGRYQNVDVSLDLPREVHPGPWKLRHTSITTMPDGSTRTATLFEFDFEVLP